MIDINKIKELQLGPNLKKKKKKKKKAKNENGFLAHKLQGWFVKLKLTPIMC